MGSSEPAPGAKTRKWRGRPPRSYWPLAAISLAALFVAAPRWSIWIRVACVAISVVVLWAAARFLDAIAGGQLPWSRQRAEPAPTTTPGWALALPGICGYLTILALVLALRAGLDEDDLLILFFLVVPLCFAGSLCGLVAALGRPGRFRTLALVANGAFLTLLAALLLLALRPKT